HQAKVYATLFRLTGDREMALDLTQDAFLRAWERLAGFEGRSAFSTWLYRIAVRLAFDALDGERRRGDVDVSLVVDTAPGPDATFESSRVAEDLGRRVDALPRMQRAVVVLRSYRELPYREIAEILETSENSARVTFHTAIRRLRAGYLKEASAR
ncbi:MAG: RNA polymerase sigma factor, partial [Gemmatimonadota bacterium]